LDKINNIKYKVLILFTLSDYINNVLILINKKNISVVFP